MSWSDAEKKWATEMMRMYYSGMGASIAIADEDIQTLVFGADEVVRRAVATAYAQSVIKPRLEASLTALDDQATLVESEIAEIPAT